MLNSVGMAKMPGACLEVCWRGDAALLSAGAVYTWLWRSSSEGLEPVMGGWWLLLLLLCRYKNKRNAT